jgi:hypothetical protein
MNKIYVTALLTLTCLLGLSVSSQAQDADGVVVTVPFEFVAGGATLPPGEYRVSRANTGTVRELAIRGYNNGGAFLLPAALDERLTDQPTLSFEHIGGKYFLSKIKTANGVYSMATPRQMIMLGQADTPSALSPSGTR